MATQAAEWLLALDFKGKQTRELLGQRDLSMNEATSIIGKAIEKPDLEYVQLPDAMMQPIFVQMGMSSNLAELILEMAARAQLRPYAGAGTPNRPKHHTYLV